MKKVLTFFNPIKKGLSRVSASWRRNEGFTLMELIIVVAIISVILGLTMVGVDKLRGKAKNTTKISNIEQIRGALQLYKNDNGFYPATLTPGSSLVGANGKTYLPKIPVDKTDSNCPTPYSYTVTDSGFEYNLNYCLSTKMDNYGPGNYVAYSESMFCIPVSTSVECGINNCGGSFGTCAEGSTCVNNRCTKESFAECPASICGDGTSLDCDGLADFATSSDSLTLSGGAYQTAVTYKAIKVGNQCWMNKNINIGVATSSTMGNATTSIQRYCTSYPGTEGCDTINGGLYNWTMAMYLPTFYKTNLFAGYSGLLATAKRQGICPSGWHIPSDYELEYLHDYVQRTIIPTNSAIIFNHLLLADQVNIYKSDSGIASDGSGPAKKLLVYGLSNLNFPTAGHMSSWCHPVDCPTVICGGASLWSSSQGNASYAWSFSETACFGSFSSGRSAVAKYDHQSVRCLRDQFNANCENKECGSDGSGGSCGSCSISASDACIGGHCKCGITDACVAVHETCTNGICVCNPNCTNKSCGSDECGGLCGTCGPLSDNCNSQGVCSCGSNVSCSPIISDTCVAGVCKCGVNSYCATGYRCSGGACVACTPSCTGKNCGDDGCGSVCGTCVTGSICTSGICKCGGVAGCDGTKANACVDGVCKCGSNPACSSSQTCTGGACGSGGGCAFVYSFDGEKYYPEHAISDFAVHGLYEYPTYGVLNKLKKVNGNYSLGVWEKVPESQYIDNVELWKIFHPQNTTVVAEQLSGKIHTVANKELPIEAFGTNKQSYLAELKTEDDKYWATDMKDFNFSKPPMYDDLLLKFSAGEIKNGKVKLVIRGKDTGFLTFNWRNMVTLAEGPNQKKYDSLNPKFFGLVERLFGKKSLKGDQNNFLGKVISSGASDFACRIGIKYFCDLSLFNKLSKYVQDNAFMYVYQKMDGQYQPVGSLMFGNVNFFHTWALELKAVNGEPIEIKLSGAPYSHQVDTVYIDRSEDQEVKIEKIKGQVEETNMKLGLPEINKSLSERDYDYFKIDLGDYIKLNFKDNDVEPDQSSTSTFLLYANAYSEAYSFSGDELKVTDKKDLNLLDAILSIPGLERTLYLRNFYDTKALSTGLSPVNKLGE